MQYIKGLENYKNDIGSAVTFGKFDGLHKGHQKLVKKVKELGRKGHLDSVVCAFDMYAPEVLMTKEERELHLEDEVDYLVECPFTKEFRELEAEVFIRDIIKGVFHAQAVVVGTDFQFGYGKRGDVHMLKAYAEKYDYELYVIEKERYKDKIISSTYIKEVVKNGDLALADILLDYNYGVFGIVEPGRKLGRTLGFPTFNVLWPQQKILPKKGVYLCRVYTEGRGYDAIANIGVKPTVSDENRVLIESFLFGYEGDAYGEEVLIELLEFVRPEQKFADKEELKACVEHDIATGKRYFKIAD
ncbi:bifunctional riboflavin kinase/FAD synthetase [Faecalicatena contorta]|uniref:bifunctional riboflavin kinase/FAD synthetase n=1 Tax=Faecalicatena contorta TaxID=39482 RepID=UPI001EED5E58|nr:bifunctional riboflavin kinase/FAD synthetase [Faecalicatena contorta]MCF2553693.1 bifunctional riboflavin kinase/FAD synthetase [Faecalicatena contorta]MCF2681069.1 bifunctional riboflavin kinase/FAD synthetase [Faecalicatena contorta]